MKGIEKRNLIGYNSKKMNKGNGGTEGYEKEMAGICICSSALHGKRSDGMCGGNGQCGTDCE